MTDKEAIKESARSARARASSASEFVFEDQANLVDVIAVHGLIAAMSTIKTCRSWTSRGMEIPEGMEQFLEDTIEEIKRKWK